MNDQVHADGGWLMGLFVLCLFAIGVWMIIRYALPKLRKKTDESDTPYDKGKSSKPEPKPEPKKEHKKDDHEHDGIITNALNSWSGILRLILLALVCVLGIVLAIWFFLGGGAAQIAVGIASWFTHAVFDPQLPNTSARRYAQTYSAPSVTVVEPIKVTRVTCTERSLQMLKLKEDAWTDWQDVPRGCAAQVDIPPSSGQYRMECLDLQGNQTGACTEYKAIRFQKVESPEHIPLTLQLWFVPIKI